MCYTSPSNARDYQLVTVTCGTFHGGMCSSETDHPSTSTMATLWALGGAKFKHQSMAIEWEHKNTHIGHACSSFSSNFRPQSLITLTQEWHHPTIQIAFSNWWLLREGFTGMVKDIANWAVAQWQSHQGRWQAGGGSTRVSPTPA
jgi:hypothetical protein